MNLRLHADSADVAAVGKLLRDGLICGVTTNPTILAEANRSLDEAAELSRKWHEEGAEEVFFQAVGASLDDLRYSADRIVEVGAIVKLPATRAGFVVARQLADQHLPTLITAVYSVAQAAIAGSLGVTYVAPYLGRLNDLDGRGHETVARMRQALAGSDTRVLVASVREPADIETLIENGITDITATPAIIEASLAHPESALAAAEFQADAELDEQAAHS